MRVAVALAGGLVVLAGCIGAPEPGPCVPDLALSSDHDAHTVDLTWSPVAGAEFYQVNRSVDEGPDEVVGFLPGNVTEYHEDGAPSGVVTYRVAADGNPSGCDGVSAHFGGEPLPPPPVECATGLEALPLDDGTVLLAWEPVENADGYDILRGQDGGDLVPFAVVSGDTVLFADLTTEAGTTYTYLVAANGLPEEGMACDVVEVTAIPFFNGPLPLAMAALATLGGAYLVARRR